MHVPKSMQGCNVDYLHVINTLCKYFHPLQVVLNSMHRYLPRVVISKYLAKKTSVVVHSQEFPECCFIAVTAYQNDQVWSGGMLSLSKCKWTKF